MTYCPLCNEYHSKFWDCAIRKVTTHNSSHPPMGIITDDKGMVRAITAEGMKLIGFYAYETAEGMRLIDVWLTGNIGIITDEKGVVKAIGESETNTEWLRGFYAYETAEGMRLIDAWLTEWAIGGL